MLLTLLTSLVLSGGFSAPTGIPVVDEAASIGRAQSLVFAGAGVACVNVAGVVTCTISGGGVGTANVVDVTVVFTSNGGYASTVVTGQAWVLTTSTIVCSPRHNAAVSGVNNTPEVYALAQFHPVVSTLVAATGFTLNVFSPSGVSGSFVFSCTGA